VTEFRIFTGIGIHDINSVEDGLHGGIIGESLEENAELHLGIGIGGVASDIHSLAGTLVLSVGSSALVSLEDVDEELDGLVVVIVLLLFDDDLCEISSRKFINQQVCPVDIT
jgi:hypothetical protein